MPVEYIGLSLRLLQADLDRLEALTAKLGNVMPRTALARQALLLGLARIEAEGLKALEPPKAPAPTGPDVKYVLVRDEAPTAKPVEWKFENAPEAKGKRKAKRK